MTGRSSKESKETAQAPSASVGAERRQLTVLFCDMVGSTRIAAELGAEDWLEMLRAYQRSVAEVVERFDGFIAQYLGDGVVAYFGHPTAHEDDAERAVRAGLAIAEAAVARGPELEARHGQGLSIRVGIHTGPVVVGGIGSGERHETLAVGAATNVAARVQSEAEPNTILISAETLRLVRGIFVVEDLGPRELKGLPAPVPLYRVVEPTGASNRLDVASVEGLTPFVGREEQLERLQESWRLAREGQGQVVLIEGEAGIGKSRLVWEFRNLLPDESQRWIACRASTFHRHSAFHPFRQLIQEALSLDPESPVEEQLSQLDEALRSAGLEPSEVAPLFASLLGLPLPEPESPFALSPEARRRLTLEALSNWLLALAARQSVVFVLEDLHWLDPSSLDLLGLLMERVSSAPVLVLPTFRPNFKPPWPTRSHAKRVRLNLLTRGQTEAMVESVTGGAALPRSVRDQVVKKTDGMPLFVEELTRTVLESRPLTERDGKDEWTEPLLGVSVPATLQDSLMARLDQLGTAKNLAQLASVLGRDFSHELLKAVSTGDHSLERDLSRLLDSGILQRTRTTTSAVYTFKHALIQDTAYGSLLKATRRAQHSRVAQVMEERFAASTAAEPERLALHCEEGGLAEKAVDYYRKAGEQAALRSASAESIQHLTRGIALLGTLPEGPARNERELAFQLELGRTFVATKGWASPGAAAAYERARELCELIGEPPQIFQVMRGLITFYVGRAELGVSVDLIARLMELATQAHESSLLLLAHQHLGIVRYFEGKPAEALEQFEEAIALYEPSEHRSLAHMHGGDLGVFSRNWTAWDLWILGRPDQALDRSREALALGEQASHPFSLAYAYLWAAILHTMRREPERAGEMADRAVAIAEPQGFAFVLVMGRLAKAWARLQAPLDQSAMEAAADEFKMCTVLMEMTGNKVNDPMMFGYLAEAYYRAGLDEQALASVDEGLARSQATQWAWWDADLHRIKGEILLRDRSDEEEAERLFRRALEIARTQKAMSFELRAAVSLSRLWKKQGRPELAYELLAPVYAAFTEGFDCRDLVEARALLEG